MSSHLTLILFVGVLCTSEGKFYQKEERKCQSLGGMFSMGAELGCIKIQCGFYESSHRAIQECLSVARRNSYSRGTLLDPASGIDVYDEASRHCNGPIVKIINEAIQVATPFKTKDINGATGAKEEWYKMESKNGTHFMKYRKIFEKGLMRGAKFNFLPSDYAEVYKGSPFGFCFSYLAAGEEQFVAVPCDTGFKAVVCELH